MLWFKSPGAVSPSSSQQLQKNAAIASADNERLEQVALQLANISQLFDLARLKVDVDQLSRIVDEVKRANDDKSKSEEIKEKYLLHRLEARHTLYKYLSVITGIVLVMIFAGDNVVRLLQPRAPSLEDRLALFIGEHSAQSAANYLKLCAGELQALQTRISTPNDDAAPAGKTTASSTANRPFRLEAGQIAKLRGACGQILGG